MLVFSVVINVSLGCHEHEVFEVIRRATLRYIVLVTGLGFDPIVHSMIVYGGWN